MEGEKRREEKRIEEERRGEERVQDLRHLMRLLHYCQFELKSFHIKFVDTSVITMIRIQSMQRK
jgi:hypothetical protein